MSLETPKWEPTQEQIIENKFDQETVNEIKKYPIRFLNK